jgi:hypothetical protein
LATVFTREAPSRAIGIDCDNSIKSLFARQMMVLGEDPRILFNVVVTTRTTLPSAARTASAAAAPV